MNRLATPIFVLFSLGWTGFSFLSLVGWTMGDCAPDSAACKLAKEWAPSFLFWRWMAVQLAAWLVFRRMTRPDDV